MLPVSLTKRRQDGWRGFFKRSQYFKCENLVTLPFVVRDGLLVIEVKIYVRMFSASLLRSFFSSFLMTAFVVKRRLRDEPKECFRRGQVELAGIALKARTFKPKTMTKTSQICRFNNEKVVFHSFHVSFVHFEAVLVLSTTRNDLFCSWLDDVSTWQQIFSCFLHISKAPKAVYFTAPLVFILQETGLRIIRSDCRRVELERSSPFVFA